MKLPLNSYNLSKFSYIIVIILLPVSLFLYCAVAPNSAVAAADGIKVMSINLLFSEIFDRNNRLKIIADYVAENDIDFVLLQEVVSGDIALTDDSAEDLKDLIFERHNLEYFVRTETIPIPIPFISDILKIGNGILSRHEIESNNARELPKTPEFEFFGIFELELKRNVMMIRANVNGFGAIHVYNTHLCAGCEINEREEQLDALLQFVQEIEGNISGENPVILGGDFNIDRIKNGAEENFLYEKVLSEGFLDAYAAAAIDPLGELCENEENPDRHCTIGVTDLGDSNAGRIDYIFTKYFRKVTDSRVIFNSAITGDPAVSDHSAVSVSSLPTFTTLDKIAYVGPPGCFSKSPCYTTVQQAITDVSTDTVLLICKDSAINPPGFSNEDVVLNTEKRVTLFGGWDTGYLRPDSGATTIKSLTVQRGTIITDTIALKEP